MSYQSIVSCDTTAEAVNCASPLRVKNDACLPVPMPGPDRTMQMNLMDTTDNLYTIENIVDDIIHFMWVHDTPEKRNDIEICDLDTNLVHNLDQTRRIREKLYGIVTRLGVSG